MCSISRSHVSCAPEWVACLCHQLEDVFLPHNGHLDQPLKIALVHNLSPQAHWRHISFSISELEQQIDFIEFKN
jgi:hypothetical protein